MTTSDDSRNNYTVSIFLPNLLAMFTCISSGKQFVYTDFVCKISSQIVVFKKMKKRQALGILVYFLFLGLRKLKQDIRSLRSI